MARTESKPMEISVQDPGDPFRRREGHLIYVKGEKKFIYVEKIDIDNGVIHEREISYEAMHDLVIVAQGEKRKRDFADSEGTDHKKLLADIIEHVDSQDNSVQVLDGGIDTVSLDHFPCDTVESVVELMHFIEVNNLTEKRPWSAIWNLYRCMLIAAKR